MIALALPSLPAALGAVYLVAGIGVAIGVHRVHRDPTATFGALLAWPLYLPMLQLERPPTRGPYAGRIDATFRALASTLADPAAGEVPWSADLSGLQAALARTDDRLALVDRLLTETDAHPTLQAARDQTGAEIEAVLEEVVQLRVQIGLAALAGNSSSVRERLTELLQRARALDEVTRTHG